MDAASDAASDENGDGDDEDNFDEQPKDYWEEQEMARQLTNFKEEGAEEDGGKIAVADAQARAGGGIGSTCAGARCIVWAVRAA